MKPIIRVMVVIFALQTVFGQGGKPPGQQEARGNGKKDEKNGIKILRFNGPGRGAGSFGGSGSSYFDEVQQSIMDTMDTLGMQNNNYSGNQSNELERLLNILKSIDELKMDLDYFKELIEKRILFEKERQEMDNEINNILSTISNRRSKAAPKYEFVG